MPRVAKLRLNTDRHDSLGAPVLVVDEDSGIAPVAVDYTPWDEASGGSLSTATLAPPLPPRVVAPPVPVPAERPCALDGVPVNSKIVVVLHDGKKHPILMTPAGEKPLTPDDVAFTLPDGARVRKDAETTYTADQLNHNRRIPSLICGTAREAIAKFRGHFHG